MLKKVNPKLTQDFIKAIKSQSSEVIDVEGLKIKVCKDVFPPQSPFSRSSEKLHTIFGDLNHKSVLDVGTGTGVQAIQAAKSGANHVLAVDINPSALDCARQNIILNGVSDKVEIRESDLFSSINAAVNKFDVMIANLPITDYPIEGVVESALYDPDYRLHKRLFAEANNYLNPSGMIIMTHINFNGDVDFYELEKMINDYGYKIERFIEIEDIGYKWRMYRIFLGTG